jgi:hypothetical protein
MKKRCKNKNHHAYARYGGRGIKVCKRWEKFENFLADMGERPKGLTLERKNNDKGYYKENCCWATYKAQRANQRPAKTDRLISFNGKTMPVRAWAREIGMRHTSLLRRLNLGMPVELALTKPPRRTTG